MLRPTLAAALVLCLGAPALAQWAECGTIVEDSSGFSDCIMFEPDSGGSFKLNGGPFAYTYGDYVLVVGDWSPFCPSFCWDGFDGCVSVTSMSDCPPPPPDYTECGTIVADGSGMPSCIMFSPYGGGETVQLDGGPFAFGVGDSVYVEGILSPMCATICWDAIGGCLDVTLMDSCVPPQPPFLRGDSNGDGIVDIADAVSALDSLFVAGEVPSCLDAADANDDGVFDIGDPVSTLTMLFGGTGMDLPAPGSSACGDDPTDDALGCDAAICP